MFRTDLQIQTYAATMDPAGSQRMVQVPGGQQMLPKDFATYMENSTGGDMEKLYNSLTTDVDLKNKDKLKVVRQDMEDVLTHSEKLLDYIGLRNTTTHRVSNLFQIRKQHIPIDKKPFAFALGVTLLHGNRQERAISYLEQLLGEENLPDTENFKKSMRNAILHLASSIDQIFWNNPLQSRIAKIIDSHWRTSLYPDDLMDFAVLMSDLTRVRNMPADVVSVADRLQREAPEERQSLRSINLTPPRANENNMRRAITSQLSPSATIDFSGPSDNLPSI